MFLSKILIKNQGPIVKFELDISSQNQPIIIVGCNGSGKSILLSYIADALYEFGKQSYNDLLGEVNTDNYFRYTGGTNQKNGTFFSSSFLQFTNDLNKYSYFEKTGDYDFENFKLVYPTEYADLALNPTEGNLKKTSQKNNDFSSIFEQNVICFFPPNRFEKPHWLNLDTKLTKPTFNSLMGLAGKLRKPLVVEQMTEDNKQWIMDVFFDSLVDIEMEQGSYRISPNQNISNSQVFRTSRNNIQDLLKKIIGNDNAILAKSDRRNSYSRLCIKDSTNNSMLVPSLDNLSSGEAVLFNLFCTIIRYADIDNVNNSVTLASIAGIIIVDEIDLHLHTDLQYSVLPDLIRLFPKVQFIVTTHSPLFLLGIEKSYATQQVKPLIIEMPKGNIISAERFSEFIKAYECLSATKAFEEQVESQIEMQIPQLISSNKKAVLYVEGITDIKHITKAWSILYNNQPIPFDIFTLNGADNIRQFIISYSKDQIGKIVMGLLDYDEKGMSIINGINNNFDYVQENIYKRKCENGSEKQAYIITLPTPSKEFSDYQYCPIEFLYEKTLLEKHHMIKKRNLFRLNQVYIKLNNDYINKEQLDDKNDLWFFEVYEDVISKNEFADIINDDNELETFKNFKPLFEKINIILNENNVIE
jgi:predicted ATPase/5S rRNA maturation endonuclease (ribonuclease M5)